MNLVSASPLVEYNNIILPQTQSTTESDENISAECRSIVKNFPPKLIKVFGEEMAIYQLKNQDSINDLTGEPVVDHKDMNHSIAKGISSYGRQPCVLFKVKYILKSDGTDDGSDSCAGYDVLILYKVKEVWNDSIKSWKNVWRCAMKEKPLFQIMVGSPDPQIIFDRTLPILHNLVSNQVHDDKHFAIILDR